MKDKKTIYIVILILLVFVGGFFYVKSKNNSLSGIDTNLPGDADIFTSVKDALSKNLIFACEFKDETGSSTKSYIKNGAVRISSTNESQETSEILVKDNKMYSWDLATKKGFIYDVSDSDTEVASNSEIEDRGNNLSAYYNMIDTYKDNCKVTKVEDSYFDIPTNISFQDMNEFLDTMMKQVPQTPQNN